MSLTRKLHPDFGPSYGDGPDYSIPITVVPSTHPMVTPEFEYADESNRVGYPFGADTKVEGGRDSGGDMHAVVVERTRAASTRPGARASRVDAGPLAQVPSGRSSRTGFAPIPGRPRTQPDLRSCRGCCAGAK